MTPRIFHWLPLLLAALIVAACGPEAPPRAAAPQPEDQSGRLRPSGVTVVPAPAPQPAAADSQPTGELRALGNPNAPITVIEYSDFQ